MGASQEGRQAYCEPDPRGRERLLPGTQISQLRQPGAARRRLTKRKASLQTKRRGVGETGLAVFLDFRDAIQRLGKHTIKERYGNLFDMYQRITGEDPYQEPMRIYPAIHYTMGGLWVDYNLMSNVPGLYVIGEANFSDHGANRLGASALMQGLADGYFVLPNTIGDYLASNKFDKVESSHSAVREAESNVTQITRRLLESSRYSLGGFLPPRTRQDRLGILRDGP